MNVVADTSAFLAVVLHEPEREALIQAVAGHELIAPEVLPYEIGNALSAMLKRQRLSGDEALQAWEMVSTIPVTLKSVEIYSALQIAAEDKIYAYDAYFLECAKRYRAPLLTLDSGLRRVAVSQSVNLLELAS